MATIYRFESARFHNTVCRQLHRPDHTLIRRAFGAKIEENGALAPIVNLADYRKSKPASASASGAYDFSAAMAANKARKDRENKERQAKNDGASKGGVNSRRW